MPDEEHQADHHDHAQAIMSIGHSASAFRSKLRILHVTAFAAGHERTPEPLGYETCLFENLKR